MSLKHYVLVWSYGIRAARVAIRAVIIPVKYAVAGKKHPTLRKNSTNLQLDNILFQNLRG